MIKSKKFSGIIVPAITPLTREMKIDHDAVGRMFENFYQHAIHPFILGTTGEGPSLSIGQKSDYLKAASRYKKDGMMLYAGISSNVLHESVEFAKLCGDHKVDALAATLPAYYQLREGEMRKYFEALADAVPLPLIIYNIPATTHMSIPLEIIDELSYHPNIVATKDSERNEERLIRSLQLWKDRNDFSHLLGWAAKSDFALLNGSDGLIPSTANYMPSIYAQMLAAAESFNEQKVHEMQRLSDEFGDLYQSGKTLGQSLWALKVLMQEQGLCHETVMPPLQSLGNSEAEVMRTKYAELMKRYF